MDLIIRPRSQKKTSKLPSSSTYQVSNSNGDKREGSDNLLRQDRSLSKVSMREGREEEIPSPNRQTPKSKISLEQRDSFTCTTSFHVRISIGYMTGLKIDEIAKRTKLRTNNRITVGFVELLSSGKYTALSQPLLTNIEEPASTTVISWANRKDGGEVSKSRRRLHFSLTLDRESSESDSRDDNDDDSCSDYSFVPEVVKLLVGLKCGDERIPLGVAKFVVNGRETFGQKMDLLVLPISDFAAGAKLKRRIFGRKQRSSFTNGKLSFKVTPNSKLRVKAEVRKGYPGQDGAEIWGDEDSSYISASKRTFESMEKRRKSRSQTHTSLCSSKSSDYESVDEFAVRYVSMASSNELVSKMSDITVPGYANSLRCCAPLFCGGGNAFGPNRMMENEIDSFTDEMRSLNFSTENS